jgi:hypothetical protein
LKRRTVVIILIAVFAILLVAGIRFGEIGDIHTNGSFL